MVGTIRLAEHREAPGLFGPGELAAVDDDAAHRRAVAAHELGQRVDDDIRPVFDRAEQDRRRDRVVDDQGNAGAVGDGGDLLDVADVARRIADALAEDGAGIVVDKRRDGLGLVAFRKADGDPLSRQDMGEQGMGGAIELRHGDDVAAVIGEVDDRIVKRGLAGADGERGKPALHQRHAPLEHLRRRIADPAVAVAFDLKIEQRGAVVGAVELVGDGLEDRRRCSFRRRIGVVAPVNCDGFAAHLATSPAISGRIDFRERCSNLCDSGALSTIFGGTTSVTYPQEIGPVS